MYSKKHENVTRLSLKGSVKRRFEMEQKRVFFPFMLLANLTNSHFFHYSSLINSAAFYSRGFYCTSSKVDYAHIRLQLTPYIYNYIWFAGLDFDQNLKFANIAISIGKVKLAYYCEPTSLICLWIEYFDLNTIIRRLGAQSRPWTQWRGQN